MLRIFFFPDFFFPECSASCPFLLVLSCLLSFIPFIPADFFFFDIDCSGFELTLVCFVEWIMCYSLLLVEDSLN